MGLDMYLFKLSKKLEQSEMEVFSKVENAVYEKESLQSFVEEYSSFDNIDDFTMSYFEHKLMQYDEWKSGNGGNEYIVNVVMPSTPKFSDFNTKEDLIEHYKQKLISAYNDACDRLKEIEDLTTGKYSDVETEEIHYWRKHADLNEYFTQLANERGVVKDDSMFGKIFNCQYLVLSREDVGELCDRIYDYLGGNKQAFDEGHGFFWGQTTEEDWVESKEVFEKILNEFDFDNNTLVYYCSW